MKWEEAIQELNKIIPSGYFTLEVEQFWHTGGEGERREQPDAPKVSVAIDRGPEGVWVNLTGVTLSDVVEKVRYAFLPKAEPPAVIEGLDVIEAEAIGIVESGEGLAVEEVPDFATSAETSEDIPWPESAGVGDIGAKKLAVEEGFKPLDGEERERLRNGTWAPGTMMSVDELNKSPEDTEPF